jgi:hypothetical protein
MSKQVRMLKDVYPFGCKNDLVSLTDEEFKQLEKVARGDDEVVYRLYIPQDVEQEHETVTASTDADVQREAAAKAAELAALKEVATEANKPKQPTKDELLKEAKELNLDVNSRTTVPELTAAIEMAKANKGTGEQE